jgi:SPP1 family predicted phage head-tail adaptor
VACLEQDGGFMRIESLKRRVSLQKEHAVRDSFGAEILQWVELRKVWAGIYPLEGREFFAAQTVNAEITIKIIIRYTEGVSPKMRIVFNNRIFEILSVINTGERKRELQLMCKEVV